MGVDRAARFGGCSKIFRNLARQCAALLSDGALFLLLNAYAARVSGPALAHLLADAVGERGGRVDWGELSRVVKTVKRIRGEIGLSFFARWSDPGELRSAQGRSPR